MAPLKNTLLVLAVSTAATSAFTPPSTLATRSSTQLSESFGFDFAEDTYKNQPDFLKGEGEYKTWIGKTKEDSFVNRQVRIFFRILTIDVACYVSAILCTAIPHVLFIST